mmetsp:Transcript_44309/g.108288  ORF Transcript_44309/g.108288 Transcript_44309/m.108288 type:complete len:209 (+) Transcript_44309:2877-3503(+)
MASVGGSDDGFEVMVRRWLELQAEPLPAHDYGQAHALHAPCAQVRGDLFPQEGGHGVACKPVENSPRFLRLDKAHVDLSRRFKGTGDRIPCDLVEDSALDRYLGLEKFEKVPADGLTLPVFVRCEDELRGLLLAFDQTCNHCLFACKGHVEGLEVVVWVNPENLAEPRLELRRQAPRAARQIPHMAHARVHHILGHVQKLLDRPGLGG